MATTNPLKVDPSRSVTLRNRYVAEIRRRYAKFQSSLKTLVLDEDAFGLSKKYGRWSLDSEEDQVKLFEQWLRESYVNPFATGDWRDKYIEQMYLKGLSRAYDDVRKGLIDDPDRIAGRNEYLRVIMVGKRPPRIISNVSPRASSPPAARKNIQGEYLSPSLQSLSLRMRSELRYVALSLVQVLERSVHDAHLANWPSATLLREMGRSVGLSLNRAVTVGRTELIRTHAEAQLDGMEALGVTKVSTKAEWKDSDTACQVCADHEDIVLDIEEAHGMVPLHPNCLCVWVPIAE